MPVIPIRGARKAAQLQHSLASLELDLSAERVKSLDDASSVEARYFRDLYNAQAIRALAYGGIWTTPPMLGP